MSQPRVTLKNAIKNGNFVVRIADLQSNNQGKLIIIVEPAGHHSGKTIEQDVMLKMEYSVLEIPAPITNTSHVVKATLRVGISSDSDSKLILLSQ